MLAVVDGTIGGGKNAGKCLAVLKLEMDAALRIEQTKIDGKATFSLEVNEVTLNEAAKVFKAALFERVDSISHVIGVASDNQRDEARHGSEVASFFLNFLGCRLASSADRATKQYIEEVNRFVNSMDDPEKRLRYEIAALADLASQSTDIDPQAFAESHLDAEDRDDFVALFREDDGTVPVVPKDTKLVKARLSTTIMEFDNGLRLTGSPAAMREVELKKGQAIIKSGVAHIGRN